MILCIDIGNTNIEIGVMPQTKGDYTVLAVVRFFTRINITGDELGIFICNFLNMNGILPSSIRSFIFSSVVPPLNNVIFEMVETYFKTNIIEVSEKTNLGITNCYKNPREVGSDRLVNAAGCFHLYKKNSIIVDMGTATTLCVLTDKGEYLGGAILPGIWTSVQALKEKASRLPAISICKTTKLLTSDTVSAIESGVYFSNYYAIKGMIEKLAAEVDFTDYLKIGTGGLMCIFSDDKIFDIIDYSLSLKGLKIIYDLNS